MQLVFLVLTGETWGYLGSRRFLHELDLHSDAVAGLTSTQIETVAFNILILVEIAACVSFFVSNHLFLSNTERKFIA